jgi:hypothetical protein
MSPPFLAADQDLPAIPFQQGAMIFTRWRGRGVLERNQ